MKLLFQSDDYGITEGVTCGILKGIREGLIRNTGLFVNMPSSKFAAEQIKRYPECCLGIDVNLVAGNPISPVDQLPTLAKPTGGFYTSVEIREKTNLRPSSDFSSSFKEEGAIDPFPLDETLIETENQILRFIELVGEKPKYIHPHSMMTPNILKALEITADKFDVPFSMKTLKKYNFHWITSDWNVKPFSVEQQLKTDVEENVLKVIPEILNYEYSMLGCHAGFVDEDIFRCSTYTVIRAKDLFMACSSKISAYIEDHKIELITYDDLK